MAYLSVLFGICAVTCTTLLTVQGHFQAKKIVFFPMADGNSPYFVLLKMAEELKTRGHKTSILTSTLIKKRESVVRHLDYALNCSNPTFHATILDDVNEKHTRGSMATGINTILKSQSDCCDSILKDPLLVAELKESDIVVFISGWVCGAFITEYLKKPFIIVHPCGFSWMANLAKVPQPPSYVSLIETSDKMNFWQRTRNLFAVHSQGIIIDKVTNYYFNDFLRGFNIKKTYAEIFAQAEMHLVSSDFAVEFAYPIMPNVFYVGPVLPKPADKLPSEFEKIINDSGKNGVILISFGSEISRLNDKIISAISDAVSKLNQTVIWKIKLPENMKVANNVKIFDWIPQNDILGHDKLKAFVSHVGANGAYEAAYHGVPLVAACIWGDNMDNAVRFVQKAKMAKLIDVFKADSSVWQNTLEEIINNSSYKRNALRVSKLIRSRPRTAVQRAGDLIEYALANGGRLPHLKAHAFNLTWYQYHCIDVMAFLVAVVILGTLVIVKLAKIIFRCFRGIATKDKLKKN